MNCYMINISIFKFQKTLCAQKIISLSVPIESTWLSRQYLNPFMPHLFELSGQTCFSNSIISPQTSKDSIYTLSALPLTVSARVLELYLLFIKTCSFNGACNPLNQFSDFSKVLSKFNCSGLLLISRRLNLGKTELKQESFYKSRCCRKC
jgi:hypothetical protein